jgi:hypothetical protein
LSKSKVMNGLQCHRRLWWTIHNRDAPELRADAELQVVFDRGSRVGQRATLDHPGGVLVDMAQLGGLEAAVRRTQELLTQDVPAIFEASFRAHDVFAAIDILYREDGGWVLGEVKSTLSAKEHHVQDAAIQAWVARESGIDVRRIEIVHLNRDHRHPNVGPLFTRTDVTEQANAFAASVFDEVKAQRSALLGVLPNVTPGEDCSRPYECPFMGRCWPALPAHHVSELYRISWAQVAELEAAGTRRIDEIDESFPLPEIAARQRLAIARDELVVEGGLADALKGILGPVVYLDFETIAPAVPMWEGCAPYQAVPVQFSVHRRVGEALQHHAWLADGPGDPRPAIAAALATALEGATSVLAYNASFERRCLFHLADAVPEYAAPLHDLADRLVDLLPLVRNHVYHPDFRGSFSLKSVAPAMCGSGYADLEIASGDLASAKLEQLLLDPDRLGEDPDILRRQLLAYCERDTEFLAALHSALTSLSTATQ